MCSQTLSERHPDRRTDWKPLCHSSGLTTYFFPPHKSGCQVKKTEKIAPAQVTTQPGAGRLPKFASGVWRGGMILNLNLSAYHYFICGIVMKLYLRKVLHWLAVDVRGIFVQRLLPYRNCLGERYFHESILVIWWSSKAVSRNCKILLQVWKHLVPLWLNYSYIERIITFKEKIFFSPGPSLKGPKSRRTKRTIVHYFKYLGGCLLVCLFWFDLIFFFCHYNGFGLRGYSETWDQNVSRTEK